MFKGLRQKIGQGLASTPARGLVPQALQEASPIQPASHAETQQNVSPDNVVSEDDQNVTPSGSLINLNDDDSSKLSLQQEQSDSLIDLSADFSGPAVLEISGSASHGLDLRSPLDRVTRSRTSSVSSQASDSFFMSVPTFPSRQLPLPSDVESITSEAEDGGVALDNISKEELYRCYSRMQQRSTKYRWKFSQVLKTYQEMEKERDKLRDTMTKSQDKAFRRISELKEQIQLDQLAKFDLEQNYVLMLEEKDEVIKVLRTQVTLLKQGKEVPEEVVQRADKSGKRSAKTEDGSVSDYRNESVLEQKIARMSTLLRASKESITKNREQVQKLSAENVQLLESIEAARMEKEQLQATVQKKDQDFRMLIEKLKSEQLRLVNQSNDDNLKVSSHLDSSFYDQIDHLQSTLLSQLAIVQVKCQTSEEQLVTKDAEIQKLHSENNRLLAEIAEHKRALENSLCCGTSAGDDTCQTSSVAVEQNIRLCSKHRLYVTPNRMSLGESTNVGEDIITNCRVAELRSSQTSESAELGAGEFVLHNDCLCIVCEKEAQLVLADEKIHSSHDRISQLEEMINQLRLKCEPQNCCVDALGQTLNQSHHEADGDEEHRMALKPVEDGQSSEMSCLKGQIESLEKQLQDVTDAHRLKTDDAERQYQIQCEDLRSHFDAESAQMSQRLSKELENLKDEVTQLERELLRQKETNELSAKTTESMKIERDSQKSLFETRLATIMEEKQNLEEELQTADERNQVVATALKDVQNLKASLLKSVQGIVQRTIHEESCSTANTEKATDCKTDEMRQNQADECDLYPEEEGQERETMMKRQGGHGNFLTEDNMEERSLRTDAHIEELQNKNDTLHLLLHEWQGCVQMLKCCLKEKEAQNYVLETNLQECQVTMEQLKAQLVEDNEKWQTMMEEVKEVHNQELNRIEEEINNRIATKQTDLTGNDEKWKAEMEKVNERNKEELLRLEEDFKHRISTNEEELNGVEEKWKGKMEEVVMLHKEEMMRLEEDFKSQITTIEREFALENKKWEERIEEVKESYKTDLNGLEEEIKGLVITKEAELLGNDEKWKVKMEEVKLLHKDELNHFEEEVKKLIATRGMEFALDEKKWQDRLEEAKNQHTEELNCLEEEKQNLVTTKEREFADLETTYKSQKDILVNENDKLRNDLIVMEDKNNQLSDQLNVSEKQIENLLITMHDLKNLKDTEEETLRHNLEEVVEKAEKSVESRIQLLSEQKDILQEQFQELKEESEVQVESARSRNETLASELGTVKLQEEKLMEEVRDLDLMNKKLKLQHDHQEIELKFLQEQLIELRVRREEEAEGEKSLADKLWLAEEQIKSVENELEKLRNQESTLQNRIKELLSQNDSDRKQLAEVSDENGELRNELKNLKEQGISSKKLQKALKVLKDKNESLGQRVKELEEQRNCVERELQETKDQHDFVCKQMKESEEQRNNINKDLQDFKVENELLIEQVKALNDQKDGLCNELLEFKEKTESLIEQLRMLEEQRDVSQKEVLEHKDQIVSLCEQAKEAEKQREFICRKLEELEEQHEHTRNELQDLKEQNGILKAQLEDIETKNQSALQEESKILEEADILRAQVIELNSLKATLENQLKQSEADSASQKRQLEEELERIKAEAEMLKEVIEQKEKKLKDLIETLSSEKMQTDIEVTEVKERLAKTETTYREELFELRKNLCALLNAEMRLVDATEEQGEEIVILRKVIETELSSHLHGLNTQMDILSKQSDDAALKAAELTEELNAAETKRLEEELILKTAQSDLEIQNGELRSEVEKLNSLVTELQDQAISFATIQANYDKTISEKDQLLREAEEKQKIMSQEGDLKQMQLLKSLEELQGTVAILSDQSADREKIASVCSQNQQRISELTDSLAKSESGLQEAEAKMETLSAEHEAERKRLMSEVQELLDQSAEMARISEENSSLLKSMEERNRHDTDEHERLLRNLKLDFDALQKNLSTKTEQIIEFENALAKKDLLSKEVEENLRRKINDSEKETERVSLESDRKIKDLEEVYKMKMEQLEGVVLNHENRIQSLKESLLEFEKIKETVEAENEQLKLKITEQLQSINATDEGMHNKLEAANSECKNKEVEIYELRKMCEEKCKILSELQEKLTVKEQEIEKLVLQLSDLKEEVQMGLMRERLIDELQERCKMDSEGLSSKINRLEAENEDQRNEMNRVISVNEENESEIDRLKVEIEEHRREVNAIQTKNEETLSKLNELNVKSDEQKCEISRLKGDNEELNNENDRLKGKIMELERERSDLSLERTKTIEAKDAACKEMEEKLLERSALETTKNEDHHREVEATENRCLEKIKELQRKFVAKLKAVQSDHEKKMREVNAENEELRLSKSALEMQLDSILKMMDQHPRVSDQLEVRISELEKDQTCTVQKTEESMVEKDDQDLIVEKTRTVLLEQSIEELERKSPKDTEETPDEQQVLDVSSCETSAEKLQLENEMVEIREQMKQALYVENEAKLKLEKSEEIVTELSNSIDMLKREIDELKVKSAEELKVQAERLEAECSDKLAELKKKAEMRLKQIKNQIQTEKDSSIAELTMVRDQLTEQLSMAKGELEGQTEQVREKENEILRLNVALKDLGERLIEETSSIRKTLEASNQQLLEDLGAKDNILEELKGRHQGLEAEAVKLNQTIHGLKEEAQQQSEKLSSLETNCKGLKKQLVNAKREIDRIKGEKDVEVRTAQLDKETEVARLMSEYKEQLKDLEIDNNSRIKQLVKEFQQKLSEKENEFQSTYMAAVEKSQREEDIMIHQHKREVKAMRLELREKEEAFEESIDQMQVQLQAAEMQLESEQKKSFADIELLKQNIEQLEIELQECRRVNVTSSNEPFDGNEDTPEKVSQLNLLGATASDSLTYTNEQLQQDVINLTRQNEELKIRYSLQVIKDQALDNIERTEDGIETTDGSQTPIEQHQLQTLELHNMDLQVQVVQQCGDIAKLKIRERTLQHEVERLNERLTGRTSECQSGTNELPSTTQLQPHLPTELQYLKNVLFKFMTGTEQQTLARVICTVLKFSEEETQEIMNHLYKLAE